MTTRNTIGTLLLVAVGGCGWEEDLLIANLKGRVFIPKEAATRQIANEAGEVVTVGPDVRLIGPVYLGLFSSIFEANVMERYPHPEVGPQYLTNTAGNTYPYGGTTVGDLRYPCLEDLTCKLTSGRFVDYDDMIDWFATIGQPIKDASGVAVEDGAYIQQTCFDLLAVTSDEEIRLTAYEDRNRDGDINKLDLDFVEDGDYYVADFTVWQQDFFWDVDQEDCTPGRDCRAFSLWGWMDAPSNTNFQFTTCDPSAGFVNNWYNSNFFGGAAYLNTLNFPSTYITDGDWTAPSGHEWRDIYEEPDIYLDFLVQ